MKKSKRIRYAAGFSALLILAALAAFTIFPQPFLSLVESVTASLM